MNILPKKPALNLDENTFKVWKFAFFSSLSIKFISELLQIEEICWHTTGSCQHNYFKEKKLKLDKKYKIIYTFKIHQILELGLLLILYHFMI